MKTMSLWPFTLKFLPGRRKATTDQVMMLAMGAAALLLPFLLRPAADLVGTHTQLFLPPCLFLKITGVPCPTCGMTTSFALLAHGQLWRSIIAHPLGALAYFYIAVLTLLMGGATILRRGVEAVVSARWTQLALALGVTWIIKLAAWCLLR